MTTTTPPLALLAPLAPTDAEVRARMREALYRTNLHSLPGILSEVTEVALNCIGEVEQALSQRMRALVKEHFTRLRSPEPMLQAELLAAMEGEG